MRLRATVGALLVVAVAVVAGAALLVVLLRQSLLDGLETNADQRASSLATQIERSGLPSSIVDGDQDDDDPDDVVTVVRGPDGSVGLASQPVADSVPADDARGITLPDADHDYVVASEKADTPRGTYVVSVAVSQEDADESTAALIPLLALGLPVVLLVVGVTVWVVVGRALAPVERMRREVDQITGERLSGRVEPSASHDEIHRLAVTMNAMLIGSKQPVTANNASSPTPATSCDHPWPGCDRPPKCRSHTRVLSPRANWPKPCSRSPCACSDWLTRC